MNLVANKLGTDGSLIASGGLICEKGSFGKSLNRNVEKISFIVTVGKSKY